MRLTLVFNINSRNKEEEENISTFSHHYKTDHNLFRKVEDSAHILDLVTIRVILRKINEGDIRQKENVHLGF